MFQLEIKGEQALLEGIGAKWWKSRGARCRSALNLIPSNWSHSALTRLKSSCSRKKYRKVGQMLHLWHPFQSVTSNLIRLWPRHFQKPNTVLQFLWGNQGEGGRNICIQSFPVNFLVCFIRPTSLSVVSGFFCECRYVECNWRVYNPNLSK